MLMSMLMSVWHAPQTLSVCSTRPGLSLLLLWGHGIYKLCAAEPIWNSYTRAGIGAQEQAQRHTERTGNERTLDMVPTRV